MSSRVAALALAWLPLALGAACAASPNPPRPQEVPEVQFKRAVVFAAVAPEQRAAIEDRVANEIHRRRPGSTVVPSHPKIKDLATISPERLRAFVDAQDFEVVVTIVPFEEEELTLHDDFSDVAGRELGRFLQGRPVHGLLGTYGVQVVAWDAKTMAPLYTYVRPPGGDPAEDAGDVADFAVDSVMGGG